MKEKRKGIAVSQTRSINAQLVPVDRHATRTRRRSAKLPISLSSQPSHCTFVIFKIGRELLKASGIVILEQTNE